MSTEFSGNDDGKQHLLWVFIETILKTCPSKNYDIPLQHVDISYVIYIKVIKTNFPNFVGTKNF